MKHILKTAAAVAFAIAALASCQPQERPAEFGIDCENITVGPEGGVESLNVSAGGKWYAEITRYEGNETPWLSISPMNGSGSVNCEVHVDTTLLAGDVRKGNIRIYSEGRHIDLKVSQTGFDNVISVSEASFDVPEYAKFGSRTVEVDVTANVLFKVEIDYGKYYDAEGNEVEDSEKWIEDPKFDFELDRESRPRTVRVKINWNGNTMPYLRKGTVSFVPVDENTGAAPAVVTLNQAKAPNIENNRMGDSLAIVACARSMRFNMSPYEGEKMDNWDFVTLWEAKDEEILREIHKNNPRNCKDADGNDIEFDIENYIGRVRAVAFSQLSTKEGLPPELKHLSTLESLYIGSNGNAFFRSFTTTEELASLTQLRELKISSFGLDRLEPSFCKLHNLEYLGLGGNNFNDFPEVISVRNFPKLKYLDLAACRRYVVFDMTTTTRDPEEWGGFSNGGKEIWTSDDGERKGTFPTQVLAFPDMEYMSLSNNYLTGNIPDKEDIEKMFIEELGEMPLWTAEDVAANDTLRSARPELYDLVGKPKILPKCRYRFSINLNLLEGDVPEWILYHPWLMYWAPDILVFNQDGALKNMSGKTSVLTGIPEDPNYFFEIYPLLKPKEYE